ncbi:hypothetical protein C8R46DRAFT_1228026 [Mycena filopes]|nr:hypothetical protein C8R46DRAFT_1228026 [Mycena filopes]
MDSRFQDELARSFRTQDNPTVMIQLLKVLTDGIQKFEDHRRTSVHRKRLNSALYDIVTSRSCEIETLEGHQKYLRKSRNQFQDLLKNFAPAVQSSDDPAAQSALGLTSEETLARQQLEAKIVRMDHQLDGLHVDIASLETIYIPSYLPGQSHTLALTLGAQPGPGYSVSSDAVQGPPGVDNSTRFEVPTFEGYGPPSHIEPTSVTQGAYSTETQAQPQYATPASGQQQYPLPASNLEGQLQYATPVSGQPQYASPASGQPQYASPASGQPQYVPPASGQQQYAPPALGQPQYAPPASGQPQYAPPASGQLQYALGASGQSQYAAQAPSQDIAPSGTIPHASSANFNYQTHSYGYTPTNYQPNAPHQQYDLRRRGRVPA